MKSTRLGFTVGTLLFLCGGSAAFAQVSGDKAEIDLFGGLSLWGAHNVKTQAGNLIRVKPDEGGAFGIRVTENIWRYVGLEESVKIYGTNNINLSGVPGVYAGTVSFGARGRNVTVGPIIYFTPPESRFRPFVQTGFGFNYFYATDAAKNQAKSATNPLFGNNPLFGPVTGPVNLGSSWKGALNLGVFVWEYGSGFKYKFSDRFGFRADVRGQLIQTPTFNLAHSNVPAYLSFRDGGPMNGMEATGAFSIYIGKIAPPPPHTFTVSDITATRGNLSGAAALKVCPGDSVMFRVTASDSYSDATVKYAWTGDPNPAGTGADYTFRAPNKAGNYPVKVHVSEDPSTIKDKNELRGLKKFGPVSPVDKSSTVMVDPYEPIRLRSSANPTVIKLGESSSIHIFVTQNACNGRLTYVWSSSEGSVSGSGADATFNSSGVQVSPGGRKRVTITGTVTDATGKAVSVTQEVTVEAPAAPPAPRTPPPPPAPKAQQLDDIVFANGSARVNNCGKRTLERLYQQMSADPDATIVLVGHADAVELKRNKNLDEQRLDNAAAVLTAGTGTCQKLEVSRLQVAAEGVDQTDDFRTALCESSVRERAGSRVAENDSLAKNRRVEVWIVPKGAQMPAGAKALKPVPGSVKRLGCPR